MFSRLTIGLLVALTCASAALAGDNGRPGFRYHIKAKITEVNHAPNLENITVGDTILTLKFSPIDGAKILQDSQQHLMKGKKDKLRPSKYSVDLKSGDELYQVYPISLDAMIFCSNTKVARRKKINLHACFIDRDNDGSFDEASTEGTLMSDNGLKYGGRFYKFRPLEKKIPYSKGVHSGSIFGGVTFMFDDKKTIKSNFEMSPNYWTDNGMLDAAKLPKEIGVEESMSFPQADLKITRIGKQAISVRVNNNVSVGDTKEFAFDNITALHYWNRRSPKPDVYELSLEGM